MWWTESVIGEMVQQRAGKRRIGWRFQWENKRTLDTEWNNYNDITWSNLFSFFFHCFKQKKLWKFNNSPSLDHKLPLLQRRESALMKRLWRWWMSTPPLQQHTEKTLIPKVTEIRGRCGYKESANSDVVLLLKILGNKARWRGCWSEKLSSFKL